MNTTAPTAVSATLHAVITRADGTVVNLGEVARWHKNPLKRLVRSIISRTHIKW